MVTIPGYRIGKSLYRGARKVVYQGYRLGDKKPVIIKTVLPEYLTPETTGTLRHEYEITRPLELTGVVKSYEMVSSDAGPALILEDFGGVSLKNIISLRGLTLELFLNIAVQIAKALAELHQRHIIHKDIKPSNIIINLDTGTAKITDFGISSLLEREHHPDALGGSLAYMSPEQTGRMNRAVDYRTDFYSAGVSFYEMLTGQLPFHARDPMEWVHYHIARVPVPPRQVNPEIPEAVSGIIMKLLAKTAEERYQGAYGLLADLEQCRARLRDSGRIDPFPIGKEDISDRFRISQKLYGREREIAALMDSFERVSTGGSELVLVSGYSGIGKSSIVREVHKPIVKYRGYFISGKFDQFRRTIPYACLIQAFRELVRQLLTESEASIATWKKKLTRALNQNGQVIIDVIPEIRMLVDEQPIVQELPPAESQNRFNLVFQDFVAVFAKQEHPLVIFIDDLQWADMASLKLIRQLITNANTRHLLMIGAYRDNEVNDTHPLMQALEEIRKAGAMVRQIALGPLSLENVHLLVSDTLACVPEVALPLAELLFGKTGGNPLFVNEFLKTLYDEGRLEFDMQRGKWRWDLGNIMKTKIPGDMVELITWKIQGLSTPAQNILSLAACIGNRFSLKTLSVVNEKTTHETAHELWGAIREGFIVSDGLFRIEGWEQGGSGEKAGATVFSFIHDRVQQAASSLIEEGRRKETRLKIGRLILKNTTLAEREERVFDIVDHLNYGKDLITDPDEKEELASLNLMAGKKAIASNAYEFALKSLTAGTELLKENSWQDRYAITSALYMKRLECEYLCGHFDAAERLFDQCLKNVKSPQEKADIYNIRIILYAHQGRYQDSVDAGREALKMFGVSIPRRPGKASILFEYLKSLWFRSWKKETEGANTVADLINLPTMSDPDQLAVMSILNNLPAPSYFLENKNMFALVTLKMVNNSLLYGNTEVSSFAYATYGMTLIGVFGKFDLGFEFGKLAMRLNEKSENTALKNKSAFVFYTFVSHWKEHTAPDVDLLKEAFQLSLKCGDFIYAANSLLSATIKVVAWGHDVDAILKETNTFLEFMGRIKDQDTYRAIRVVHQMARCLKGRTRTSFDFSDDAYNEAEQLRVMKEKHTVPLHWYYLYKTQALYILGHHEAALSMAVESDAMLETSMDCLNLADHYLYYSLTLASLYPTAAPGDKARYAKTIERNRLILKKWSEHCPENFQHKYLVVSAECGRLFGRPSAAVALYEQAAEAARKSGYNHIEAICNELAGRFYLERKIVTPARAYIAKAHEGYLRWGATAKVNALEASYPEWFKEPLLVERARETTPAQTQTPSSSNNMESLDLMSIIKASQALSSEIQLEALLDRLMKIVIENAGARRGLLILERNGRLYIEAEGTADHGNTSVFRPIPVDGSKALAESIVHYAARTLEPVVLDDAAHDGRFTHDPYILDRAEKSVLCAPIVHQGKLTGIVYLENNLTSHAFTPKRVEILEALSSQIAISLKNARLFSELKQETAERMKTQEESILHYQQRIAEEQRHESEKEKILMDIHDGIGGITTNISLLAALAQKASSPVDVNKALTTIANLSREGIGEIRSLMQSLDSKDLSWPSLIAELRTSGASAFAPHAIDFELTAKVDEAEAAPKSLLCLNLFRIYREALTNIIKHSRATTVVADIKVDRERLVLFVRDNGLGKDETEFIGKGRGMSNMKNRAMQIGGVVTITAKNGTCVRVDIPLSAASPEVQ